ECPNDRPRPTHCDLMLESGEALQTWSLKQLPRDWLGLESTAELRIFASSNTVEAERLAEHRLEYLGYEGPVSGDRGSVRRLDAGTFVRRQEPLSFSFEGRFIRGAIMLQQSPDDDARWQLIYQPAASVTDS
ncbi:MAG: hypothetical protein WD971_06610, partial [Pirellulales bacterium]